MTYRIFLAGASGVIGYHLVPRLVRAGHSVVGMTRSTDKMDALKAQGVEPVLVDVFDRRALIAAVAAARPNVVLHQLTDLPDGLDQAKMAEHIDRNARIREEGTNNLVAAALAAGVDRMVAQSIAWVYAPGPEPHLESDPLDLSARGVRAITVRGVVALEMAVLHSPPLSGVVLRYGALYGEGTGFDLPRSDVASVHVTTAADAAVLAVERPVTGIFNIANPGPWVSTRRAEQELGW